MQRATLLYLRSQVRTARRQGWRGNNFVEWLAGTTDFVMDILRRGPASKEMLSGILQVGFYLAHNHWRNAIGREEAIPLLSEAYEGLKAWLPRDDEVDSLQCRAAHELGELLAAEWDWDAETREKERHAQAVPLLAEALAHHEEFDRIRRLHDDEDEPAPYDDKIVEMQKLLANLHTERGELEQAEHLLKNAIPRLSGPVWKGERCALRALVIDLLLQQQKVEEAAALTQVQEQDRQSGDEE